MKFLLYLFRFQKKKHTKGTILISRLIASFLLLITFPLFAQLSGGGDLNPDLSAPKKAQEDWQDLKIGLSIHWGLSSLGGKELKGTVL